MAIAPSEHPIDVAAQEILTFWFDEAGPEKWFGGGADFDALIGSRFEAWLAEASNGKLDHWADEPNACLALIIILDQFSRNLFRDSARAFENDDKCLALAKQACERGFDLATSEVKRPFFYLPFMHSEDLLDQERCVALFEKNLPGSSNIPFAKDHLDVIKRFGRFPYRNAALGRTTTSEEQAYLDSGDLEA